MPRVLPTRSSSNNLTIVRYSGGAFFPNDPIITLSQDLHSHTIIHTLEIKTSVFAQEPQIYKLPEMQEGAITLNLLWGDEINSDFTIKYNDAKQLYNNGLLIYLALFDGYYVYFVSGSNVICYSRPRDSSEWVQNSSPPRRRAIEPYHDGAALIVVQSDWKKNQWVTNEYNSP